MKEIKPKEVQPRDVRAYDDDEYNPANILALPSALKAYLIKNELDWRFMNASAFRNQGGYHSSQFKPLKVTPEMGATDTAITAEGLIARGDLILGVRSKKLSAKYREVKDQRNRQLMGFNKDKARELRETAARAGIRAKVHEGYDEDERGFAGGERED